MRIHGLCRQLRAGFTLAEAMTAVTIVTVACSAMLFSVGQAMQASRAGLSTGRANLLAQELMNEIGASRWADADEPDHWGPENGELTKTRAAFDDLDDYDGWSGPPQTRDGQLYDTLQTRSFPDVPSHAYGSYTCSVHVEMVSAAGESVTVGMSPYRRVTVEVTQEGGPTRRLSQVFQDHALLLGRNHWFDPNYTEPVATVQVDCQPVELPKPVGIEP